ncbi:MAG TPA: DUF5110 domain-containing protein, partial [Polyangiaceae bacterium]
FPPLEEGPGVGGLLQEDDGTTTAYVEGAFLRTRFSVERGERLGVRAHTTGRGFPEHRRSHFRVVLHGSAALEATLDGRPVSFEAGALVFPCVDAGFELGVRLAQSLK